ncbi:MAG TPA: DHA2 family efflux MFS transporter permease subunit [Methylomirabilota bacterium]|nr:DHA2 family efflux MFS transporter permease subunit [Methylomirabilota bacterium]
MDDLEWRPRHNPWLIAVSVMLGTFMEVLDTSVANVALPHIGGSLSATPEEATWVLTSYLVSNAIILPTTAWLTSVFGRKRFLLACIMIFTLSSALCGAATSLGMLIVARVVQGAGGGALQPIAQAILMESFPPARRGVAMATFSMGIIVAPILGPTLGGYITDQYTWRWVFYINLPIGLLAMLLVLSFIEDPPYLERSRLRRMDYLGFGCMSLGLGALQIMLDRGQEDDWFSSTRICVLAIVSGTALVAFVIRELLTDEPIVNFSVLRERNFAVGAVLVTMLGVVLYGTTAMLPLFLQTLLGYTALNSGLAVSPRGFGAMLAAFVVGRLIGIVESRLLLAVGFGALAFSGWMYSRLTLDITMSNVVGAGIINGAASGLIFVPLSTTALGLVPRERMGNAAGIYNLMRNIGAGVGISMMTTLLARRAQVHQVTLVSHVTPYDPAVQEWLRAARAALGAHGNPFTAPAQALGVLYAAVVRQATLLAFLDNFRLITLAALCCMPLLPLFRRARGRPAARAH